MTKLVCGKVSQELIDECGADGFFKGADGNLYEFSIEVENEGRGEGFLRITDSIGRVLPVDFESLDSLVRTLYKVKEYRDSTAAFDSYWINQFSQG